MVEGGAVALDAEDCNDEDHKIEPERDADGADDADVDADGDDDGWVAVSD
jgi:hypothetical protein